MLWTHVRRIVKSGLVNFWRNKVVAIASVFVITVTLFVIGGLIMASAFLNASLNEIQAKVDVSVTFNPDVAEADVLAVKQSLETQPGVTAVTYTSREDELKNFRELHKDNSLLIQSLDELGNPFGARLSVRAADPSHYEAIATFLEGKNDESGALVAPIDKITFKKDLVDRLIGLIDATRKVGLAVSVVLIAMSVLVTFNTISLAIYISREEISVMRLVGAGDNYVRGPFMVEGLVAGILSAFIAMILLYPAVIWVKDATASVYGGVTLVSYYLSNFAQIFLILLGSGMILGTVSSYLAIRKYIKI
ncbi:MAG TPA: permease-like cell division protein FtsX [Candidatus Paceibacterota bacterium]|nr:permease-like cell division protein FtsX [Candidatus Paceibacterota bacterium]